jgi:SPP1 family predicted phage head-tail adaptor
MAISAGKLFHEIAIEQRGDTRNAYGESVASWSSYKALEYAEVKNLSGNELIQAAQINSKINTKFVVRYDSGIRATMRIVYKSRNYNIISVDNDLERDEKMTLLCERLEDVTNG